MKTRKGENATMTKQLFNPIMNFADMCMNPKLKLSRVDNSHILK